jgi:2-polyprenyl-6-methoxyphenol hydroxylase-like FAD-dependent oxidoreductase
MDVAIVGGGICGLSLALNLKERGIACRVYERAPEIKELGVGITLLPHAMREFNALGVGETLFKTGIENRDCAFFNRFGQLIYREDRGKFAGYPFPEVGIHRGRLHVVLYEAVQQRLGREAVINARASSRTKPARPFTSGKRAPDARVPASALTLLLPVTASIRPCASSSTRTTRLRFPASTRGAA